MKTANRLYSFIAVFFLVTQYLTPTIFAGEFHVATNKIVVNYDEQLHRQLEWLGSEGPSIIETDDSAQTGVKVNGKMITDFRIQQEKSFQEHIRDAEFGQAVKGVVTGIYQDSKMKIERQTHILLPEKFPDVVVFYTIYRNLSDVSIHLDKIYSQRLLLNRQLAEPEEKPYQFASFQGGVYKWGSDYSLIWLKPGFFQRNFMGIHDVDNGQWVYQVGGGMPIIDVWGRTMGVAIAHLEKKPACVALPVTVRKDGRAEMAITEEPEENLGQQEWLKPGESYETVWNAVIFHKLDYHDPLRIYGNLLRSRGVAIRERSSPSAHEPYWMSWGFREKFTTEMILNRLQELKSMGITRANLDAGWFDYLGDWNPIRTPGKFPNGESDMIAFVEQVHKKGFNTALWWYPLGVSPESNLAKDRPDLLVQSEDGHFPKDEMGVYQLCPAHKPALEYIEALVTRFVDRWGFDGFYLDKIGQAAVPPCYNKAHNHASPLESFEAVPEVFKRIERTLHKYVNDPFIDVCICATPHSPYNMPFYSLSSASDPVNPQQMRRRIKVEKAIHGPTYAVGDAYQVPADEWDGFSVPQSFESAMGAGAKMSTFYADLDSTQLKIWQRWFRKFRELGLDSGEYLNYYDIAFDKPEVHVVRKGRDIYYGIFANYWPRSEKIELRGLDKDVTYEIYDYAHDRQLGSISGSAPYLNIGFKESLLIQVRPIGSE